MPAMCQAVEANGMLTRFQIGNSTDLVFLVFDGIVLATRLTYVWWRRFTTMGTEYDTGLYVHVVFILRTTYVVSELMQSSAPRVCIVCIVLYIINDHKLGVFVNQISYYMLDTGIRAT